MDNISQKAASSLTSNNCFDLISYTRFPDAPKRSSSIPALAAVPIISNYSNRLDDELMKPRVVSTQRHLKGCSLFLDTALCQLQGTFNLESNKNSRE